MDDSPHTPGSLQHRDPPFLGERAPLRPARAGQQYRHNDAIDALWGLLDTVPEGRGDFEPALSYRA
jgi:predicted dithiol-disulfide oxidoreductase (DUF899 family)